MLRGVQDVHRHTGIAWLPDKPFDEAAFMDYLGQSLRARHLSNSGPLQAVLGARLAALTGTSARCVVPMASGTGALHALCAAWELQRGRPLTWATSAYTFATSVQGPCAQAHVVDLDAQLGGPCLAALGALSPPPDGVVLTNPLGLQADVLAYERWCKERGILLVQDNAATPIGVLPDGRCIHDAGDGAIISLHETKQLGRGEGGAVLVPRELVPLVYRASSFGFTVDTDGSFMRVAHRSCSNWKMSDVAAAAILAHLDTVERAGWPARLGALFAHAAATAPCVGLSLRHAAAPGLQVRLPSMPPCLLVELPENCRDEGAAAALARTLQTNAGIEARRYYTPLAPRSEAPRAWTLWDASICLPLHADMDKTDIEHMLLALADAARLYDANGHK